MPSPLLVLASTSPYRRLLLERLRLAFEVQAPAVDEIPLPGEAPPASALRLACAKAQSVAAGLATALVIGSDQVAELAGTALGKPGTHERARAQLQAMRGQRVVFHTAVALVNAGTGALQSAQVPTVVRFRDYSDDEIERYLLSERPYDCAGSAKIEGLGIAMVDHVSGDDPTALIGLPLIRLAGMLRREGMHIV